MPRLHARNLGRDAEQLADEILEMRREIDEEIGLILRGQFLGRGAAGGDQRKEAGIGRLKMRHESGVEPREPVTVIEIREVQTMLQYQIRHATSVIACLANSLFPLIFLGNFSVEPRPPAVFRTGAEAVFQ